MKWYCYKTEYGKATEAVMKLWDIIYKKSSNFKSTKIYYRQNQGVITDIINAGKEFDKKNGDNPFYRDMNIFTSGTEVIMDYAETPENKYGFEVVHENNIWYQIKPENVSEIINPYENGNVNLIIAGEDADIKNWEYYVNCFEYDDCEYMLAFNARNKSEVKALIAESGLDFLLSI